jgi:hypothetical protein
MVEIIWGVLLLSIGRPHANKCSFELGQHSGFPCQWLRKEGHEEEGPLAGKGPKPVGWLEGTAALNGTRRHRSLATIPDSQ